MLKDNLHIVKEQIAVACRKTGRIPGTVSIVAVSKGRSIERIKEAYECGLHCIGENRVQEALLKYQEIQNSGFNLSGMQWHMIGHLQSNKTKEAVKLFDMIQSVDTLALAQSIDKEASRIQKIQNILLEVKVSPESTKYGFLPRDLKNQTGQIFQLNHIAVKGLMTIAPLSTRPEEAEPFFRILKNLRDELEAKGYTLPILSMGMSDDFMIAIEEGSTMVRLGRALFGE